MTHYGHWETLGIGKKWVEDHPHVVTDADLERWRQEELVDRARERGEYMLRIIPRDMTITDLAQAIYEYRGSDPESELGLKTARWAGGLNEPMQLAPKDVIPPER